MTDFEIKNLGCRICIIGPSSSGKSTLARLLSQKIGGKICHLDQIAHQENSSWVRRPKDDFISDHDAFIANDAWVVDGNYSICMPQRFAGSTAVIWLDPPLWGFLWRYIKRSLQNDPDRAGNLAGAKRQFSFDLIKYTFFNYPKSKKKYAGLLENYSKPIVRIRSMKDLNKHYVDWGIGFQDH
jgi:adenylate kinase family enzyme